MARRQVIRYCNENHSSVTKAADIFTTLGYGGAIANTIVKFLSIHWASEALLGCAGALYDGSLSKIGPVAETSHRRVSGLFVAASVYEYTGESPAASNFRKQDLPPRHKKPQ